MRQRNDQIDALARRLGRTEERLGDTEAAVEICSGKIKGVSQSYTKVQMQVQEVEMKIEQEFETFKTNQNQLDQHAMHLEDGLARIENVAREQGLPIPKGWSSLVESDDESDRGR